MGEADEQVMSALRAGASGFLVKDTPPAQIINAVGVVASGDAILSLPSPALCSPISATLRPPSDAAPPQSDSPPPLTANTRWQPPSVRASNAEVAASLFMSEATVKAHVWRLFTKLDATNRVQIAIAVHAAEQP